MSANQQLQISVIIPVYNNWEDLKLCLEALNRQTMGKDFFEIIIVNNASTIPKPEGLLLSENARIVNETKPGSYAARNTGAEVANGLILAFTDSDCIPDENWLKSSRNIFENTACDMVGGEIKIFRPENGSKHTYIYEKHFAFRQKEWVPDGISCTANLLIYKKTFFEAGKFDSTLKSGGDWEFSKRCVNKGYIMEYGEPVIVLHPARKNLRAMLKKHFRHVCWGAIITREKYECSQFKVLLSDLKGALSSIFRTKPRVSNLNERLVIFYLDFIKMLVQIYGNLLLLFNLKDPHSVRE